MTTYYNSGSLGNADLAQDTDTSLGTLGAGMTVNICLTNRTTSDCKIRIAISASASAPSLNEYIDYDNTLYANRSRERGGIAISSGKTIWVRSNAAGVSACAHGVLLP